MNDNATSTQAPSLPSDRVTGEGRHGRARRWAVPVVLATVLATLVMWQASKPKLFRAESVVEYAPDPAPRAATSNRTAEEWYATQDYILASSTIAGRAVDVLRLRDNKVFSGAKSTGSTEPSRSEAMTILDRHRRIRRVEGTRLVRVSFDSVDPSLAAQVANAIAQCYLEKTREDGLQASRRTVGWLDQQVDRTKLQLVAIETELEGYLRNDVDSALPIAERQQMISAQIRRLQDELTRVRVQRIALSARVAKLREAQRADPFATYATEVDEDPQVKQLRADHLAAILRYQETSSSQGEVSLPAEQQHGRLDAMRDQLQLAIAGITSAAQAELSEVLQVESQLRAELQQVTSIGHNLQLQELVYGRYARERAAAETLLNSLRVQSTSTLALSAGDGSWGRIVEPATPPPGPLAWWSF